MIIFLRIFWRPNTLIDKIRLCRFSSTSVKRRDRRPRHAERDCQEDEGFEWNDGSVGPGIYGRWVENPTDHRHWWR